MSQKGIEIRFDTLSEANKLSLWLDPKEPLSIQVGVETATGRHIRDISQIREEGVFRGKTPGLIRRVNLILNGGGVEKELIEALRMAADDLEKMFSE